MSAYTDRMARQHSAGYAEAFTDLLNAYDTSGVEGLAEWMTNNASNNDSSDLARAADLLRDVREGTLR